MTLQISPSLTLLRMNGLTKTRIILIIPEKNFITSDAVADHGSPRALITNGSEFIVLIIYGD